MATTTTSWTLTEEQKDQIMMWARMGYSAPKIQGLAKNQGFDVSKKVLYNYYLPKARRELEKYLEKNPFSDTWFAKEYRAERAAEMAEMLYGEIMDGKIFAEEVTEKEALGGVQRTTKPVYFAGMIKNWSDLLNTIRVELGQNNKVVELNYNKNQNLNISFLIDKIFEEDEKVNQQIEGAEIIDIPSDSDFGDDEGFLNIVNGQTSDEIKGLIAPEDKDGDDLFE